MSRNRVIYNVQDLFIGSSSGERNISITGLANHQILQRINGVQSFDYSINTSKLSESVLGRSSAVIQEYPIAPEISVNFSYFVNGVNNEIRMGLNPVSEMNYNSSREKNFLHSLLVENETLGKNIYLITKNDNNDTHNYSADYPDINTLLNLTQKNDIEHPDSLSFGVGIFQNSYLIKYSIAGGVGKLTTVNVSYISDNFLGFSSGTNLNIPDLNFKSGVVVDRNKKFIIPKSFKKDRLYDRTSLISTPKNIYLAITKHASDPNGYLNENAVDYLNNAITDFSFDIDIPRENINYIGHKMSSQKVMKFPVIINFNLNMIYQNDAIGSFTDNIKEKEVYDVVLELKNDASENICKYTLLGCTLDSVSDNGSIGDNRAISLSFITDIDFEKNNRGIFIEGKVDEICENVTTDDNEVNVLDSDDKQIQFGFFPRY